MKKIDFIGFIEVRNANPNGDIDFDNQPRQDVDGYGYMTDVCIKRKIRDTITLLNEGKSGYDMFVNRDGIALETKAMTPVINNGGFEHFKDMSPEEKHEFVKEEFMKQYYDVRAFGAVVPSYTKAHWQDAQIQGPVQISFAESLEPVQPEQITISRISIQTEKDLKEKNTELGKKWIVPYAVYKFEGHISANLAEQTGFTEEDKEALLEAIWRMYDYNHSASKTGIDMLKLFVFEHDSKLGNCKFRKLDEAIIVEKTQNKIGREQYSIEIDEEKVPESVKVKVYK